MHTGLAGEKENNQGGEKHHVAGQPEENEEPDLVQQFARSSMLTFPVVVASAASASGRPPVNRWFSADSWFFPFDFRRGSRKGNGHQMGLCVVEITPTLAWTHKEL
jgi:hypothetical protein